MVPRFCLSRSEPTPDWRRQCPASLLPTLIHQLPDDKFIEESLFNAQRLYLEPLIGTVLYNSLGTKILNGTIGDAGNEAYQTVLDNYIVPALVKMCVYETLLPLTYKITPKLSSDNLLKILKYLVLRKSNMLWDRRETEEKSSWNCYRKFTAIENYSAT